MKSSLTSAKYSWPTREQKALIHDSGAWLEDDMVRSSSSATSSMLSAFSKADESPCTVRGRTSAPASVGVGLRFAALPLLLRESSCSNKSRSRSRYGASVAVWCSIQRGRAAPIRSVQSGMYRRSAVAYSRREGGRSVQFENVLSLLICQADLVIERQYSSVEQPSSLQALFNSRHR